MRCDGDYCNENGDVGFNEIGLTQNCPSKTPSRRQYACTARLGNAAGVVLRNSYERIKQIAITGLRRKGELPARRKFRH